MGEVGKPARVVEMGVAEDDVANFFGAEAKRLHEVMRGSLHAARGAIKSKILLHTRAGIKLISPPDARIHEHGSLIGFDEQHGHAAANPCEAGADVEAVEKVYRHGGNKGFTTESTEFTEFFCGEFGWAILSRFKGKLPAGGRELVKVCLMGVFVLWALTCRFF